MRHVTIGLVLIALLLVGAYAFYGDPGFVRGQSSAGSKTGTAPNPQLEQQTLFSGLWRVDGGFVSTIQIKNSLIVGPAVVTPVLYMADGTPYELPPVRLATAGIAAVNVNQALAQAPPHISAHVSQYGSAALRYTGLSMSVLASMEILDPSRSLIFGYPFDTPMAMETENQTLEGLWWKHDPGVGGFVSFANVTDRSKEITLQVIGAEGSTLAPESLTLGAHVTQVLDLDRLISTLPPLEGEVGGMRVTYTGKFDDVMIGGGLENDREGYSAGLPFWSSDPMSAPEKITIANVGLMLGEPDPAAGFPGGTFFTPYLVLRNTTSRPIEVRPTLYTIGRARGLPLPRQHLKPFQSEQVDVKAILEPLGLARMSGSANLTLSYTGRAGDLGVAAGSIDQTASYVFGVLSQQVMQTQSKEVPYWTVANGFDTMFALWNPTDEAQDIVAIFYYGDGSGQYKLPLHLEAEGSAMIDMAQLVANGRPDADGNLFPTTVRAGSVVFQSRKGFAAPMNLSINAATFNAELGTCLQHCICCTGISSLSVTPNPCDMVVGASMSATATEKYNNGTTSNVTSSMNWSSNNTAVCTVQTKGSTSPGLVHGVSAGSATISASGSFTRPGQVCGVGTLTWVTIIVAATATANVAYLTCGAATRGSSLTCQINNLPTGATISNWKFTDGTNTVTTSSTGSSWSGTAVQSGTVSVTVASGGQSPSLSSAWTVNARSGWAFTAVSANKVPNGSAVCLDPATVVTLASPPPAPSGGSNETVLGYSCLTVEYGFTAATVSGGPNDQYKYVASVSATNPSKNIATTFNWLRIPDLDGTMSTFYVSQCGNYNATSNPNGFISGANLAAQVQRHEAGGAVSHWAEYKTAQDNPSNNLGAGAEPLIGTPSTTMNTFSQATVPNTLNAGVNAITSATSSESIPGVNYDALGNFLGYVNYAPYHSCQ